MGEDRLHIPRNDLDRSKTSTESVTVNQMTGWTHEDHSVAGRITLSFPEHLFVGNLDLGSDIDMPSAARLIWAVIGDGAEIMHVA